jgi:hypothetical protein
MYGIGINIYEKRNIRQVVYLQEFVPQCRYSIVMGARIVKVTGPAFVVLHSGHTCVAGPDTLTLFRSIIFYITSNTGHLLYCTVPILGCEVDL